MLIVLAGLPGTGKSTIARVLAAEDGAVWLRIDSIEQAIRASGVDDDDLRDAGYRVAHALAEDNLRHGLTVIGDSVNPWMLTRNAWRNVGLRAGVRVLEIETICSDAAEHRRRIEGRSNDVPGLALLDWHTVVGWDYHAWDREHVTVDTAGCDLDACIGIVRRAITNLAGEQLPDI